MQASVTSESVSHEGGDNLDMGQQARPGKRPVESKASTSLGTVRVDADLKQISDMAAPDTNMVPAGAESSLDRARRAAARAARRGLAEHNIQVEIDADPPPLRHCLRLSCLAASSMLEPQPPASCDVVCSSVSLHHSYIDIVNRSPRIDLHATASYSCTVQPCAAVGL